MTTPILLLTTSDDPAASDGPQYPEATRASLDAHQWYVTSTTPAATLSIGRTHGPTGRGVYIATAEDGFVATDKSMAIQVRGRADYDAQGPWALRVNDATTITTTSHLDVKASSNVTVVAGEGHAAVFAPTSPGAEGGDPSRGLRGAPPHGPALDVRAPKRLPAYPKDAPRGHAGFDGPGATGYATAGVVTAVSSLISGGLGAKAAVEGLMAFKGASGLGAVIGGGGASAITGAAGLANVGVGIGVTVYSNVREGKADPLRKEADGASDALPPEGPVGEGPNVDLTAAEKILGKSGTGIAWYTPAAIKSTAGKVIESHAPILRNHADVEIVSRAGDFIKNHAGTAITNDATLKIANSTLVWSTTAKVSASTTAFVSNSNLSFVAASMTGLVGASVTGLALCKVSSFGLTSIEGGVKLKLKGAALEMSALKGGYTVGTHTSKVGELKETVLGTVKRVAASVKETAASWKTTAATVKVQSPNVNLGL